MSTQFAGESYAEKAERKFRENPAVPIGALATTAALTMAMFKMRAGDAKSFNNWLRMRVVFQGITIAAVCWGTYSFSLNRKSSEEQAAFDALEEQRRREEKAAREKLEFEERLRAAEEMHNAELSARNRTVVSAPVSVPREPTSPPSSAASSAAPPPRSSGWKSWLGW